MLLRSQCPPLSSSASAWISWHSQSLVCAPALAGILLHTNYCVIVSIEASKDGIKFHASGDIGNGAVTLRSHTNAEKPEMSVDIELSEPVSLTFSLKYLVNFCKAAGLSKTVKLCLSSEVPLLVEYNLSGSSYLRFYLAPKVSPLPYFFMLKLLI